MGVSESLDRFFEISGRGSTISTEVKGGVLIFLSMVYIIAVNTGMMVAAGMEESACYTATIVMAIIGTLLMALYAKFPVAQAPLMGVNAFFAYTIAGTMGFSWQEALVAVLISGVIFFVIAITGVRKRVLDQIPASLRFGITAGIGCFIVFIGLQNAGLIADSTTLVGLGDFSDPAVILAFFCIILTLFLYAMRVPGAVFFGMIVTAVIGVAIGTIPLPDEFVSMPAMPPVGDFMDGISSNLLDRGEGWHPRRERQREVRQGPQRGFRHVRDQRTRRSHPHGVLRGVHSGNRSGSKDGPGGVDRRVPVRRRSVRGAGVLGDRIQLHGRSHGDRRSRDDNPAQGRDMGRLADRRGGHGDGHHHDPHLLDH